MKPYEKCVGHLYRFRYGDALYKFVYGVQEVAPMTYLLTENIGGSMHGIQFRENPVEFFSRYVLVS